MLLNTSTDNPWFAKLCKHRLLGVGEVHREEECCILVLFLYSFPVTGFSNIEYQAVWAFCIAGFRGLLYLRA